MYSRPTSQPLVVCSYHQHDHIAALASLSQTIAAYERFCTLFFQISDPCDLQQYFYAVFQIGIPELCSRAKTVMITKTLTDALLELSHLLAASSSLLISSDLTAPHSDLSAFSILSHDVVTIHQQKGSLSVYVLSGTQLVLLSQVSTVKAIDKQDDSNCL